MNIPTEIWLLIAYAIGSWIGYRLAINQGRREGIELSIDSLIKSGYLKSKINEKGETVIYKHWEDKQ